MAFSLRPGLVLAAFSLVYSVSAASGVVNEKISYIWPSLFINMSLFPPLNQGDLGTGGLASRLAVMAQTGREQYLQQILHKELSADPGFAAEFEGKIANQHNDAFMRWQKLIFSKRQGLNPIQLDWRSPPPTFNKSIRYKWPAFYRDADQKRLRKNVLKFAAQWSHITGGRDEEEIPPQQYAVFLWAEVYGAGELQLPRSHPGALFAGLFVAQLPGNSGDAGGAPRITLLDSRGSQDPFGKSHELEQHVGDLLAWSPWTPHMIEPHQGNGTAVYLRFLVYPPDADLDWEDDPSGDWEYNKKISLGKPRGVVPVQIDRSVPKASQRSSYPKSADRTADEL